MAGRRPTTPEIRFAEKCNPVESGCIEWTGGGTHNGYGTFYAEGKQTTAHRWLYERAHGKQPRGIDICHRCDNRRCVNLEHLFAGTRKENMEDAVRKNRMDRTRKPRGEAHGLATVTEAQVLAMRELASRAEVAEVARSFGTTYMVAYRVINRFTWKHI